MKLLDQELTSVQQSLKTWRDCFDVTAPTRDNVRTYLALVNHERILLEVLVEQDTEKGIGFNAHRLQPLRQL